MLHVNTNDLKLQKVFIEIRYRDNFLLPTEKRFTILHKLSDEHPIQFYEKLEQLSLLNPEKKRQINIFINRLVIDWDDPTTIDDFVNGTLVDMNFILKTLEINHIQRIGLRAFHSIECQNDKVISEYIFKEYLSPKFKSKETFADEISSPRIIFSGKRGSLLFNFSIGYQQQQIIEGQLNSQLNSVHQEIKHLLTFDLDCFQENLAVSKLEKFINAAKEQNNLLPSYIKSLEG
jgi:hypothetical protein